MNGVFGHPTITFIQAIPGTAEIHLLQIVNSHNLSKTPSGFSCFFPKESYKKYVTVTKMQYMSLEVASTIQLIFMVSSLSQPV